MQNEITERQDNLPEWVGERLGQIFVVVFLACMIAALAGLLR